MSYHDGGMIKCDVCGNADFAPASPRGDGRELVGWERIYSHNDEGLPEHACSPKCKQEGLKLIERRRAGN
jgi:hypothetical protein